MQPSVSPMTASPIAARRLTAVAMPTLINRGPRPPICKRHWREHPHDAPDLGVLVSQAVDACDAFLPSTLRQRITKRLWGTGLLTIRPTSMKWPVKKTATVHPFSSFAALSKIRYSPWGVVREYVPLGFVTLTA